MLKALIKANVNIFHNMEILSNIFIDNNQIKYNKIYLKNYQVIGN